MDEQTRNDDQAAAETPIASLGGKASAAKLTPEERTERAKRAAEARWNADIPQATHSGELKIGDIVIPCAVLDDETRVLTQRGFSVALGRGKNPKNPKKPSKSATIVELPVFLSANNLKPFIDKDLERSATQIKFRMAEGPGGFAGNIALGYRAELLQQVCNVYLKAERAGVLRENQKHIAERCLILLNGFATVGIIALIDEATGYQFARPADELRKILERYLSRELAKWVLTFQPDYYREMYRLRGWSLNPDSKKKPGAVAKYTIDLVYNRIQPDLLQELKKTRTAWEEQGRSKGGKLFQFLTTDMGHPRLKQHLEGVIQIMRFSTSWNQFMYRMNVAYPKPNETPLLSFPDDEDDDLGDESRQTTSSSTEPQPPS